MFLFRVAPYQILLHDGRLIYAPQDVEQVIRLRAPHKDTDPASPEFILPPDDEEDECESKLIIFIFL